VIFVQNFLTNLNYKLRIFMRGRYGFDILSRFLSILSLIFLLFSYLFAIRGFYYIAAALLFWAYFRCFSKNLDKRGRELCNFLKIKNRAVAYFSRRKKMFADRKTHKFFKCKTCGTYSRVPRGKGKIKITCGVCKNTMVKTT